MQSIVCVHLILLLMTNASSFFRSSSQSVSFKADVIWTDCGSTATITCETKGTDSSVKLDTISFERIGRDGSFTSVYTSESLNHSANMTTIAPMNSNHPDAFSQNDNFRYVISVSYRKETNTQEMRLKISRVECKDVVDYRCLLRYTKGRGHNFEASKTISMAALSPPFKPDIQIISPADINATELRAGGFLTLTCRTKVFSTQANLRMDTSVMQWRLHHTRLNGETAVEHVDNRSSMIIERSCTPVASCERHCRMVFSRKLIPEDDGVSVECAVLNDFYNSSECVAKTPVMPVFSTLSKESIVFEVNYVGLERRNGTEIYALRCYAFTNPETLVSIKSGKVLKTMAEKLTEVTMNAIVEKDQKKTFVCLGTQSITEASFAVYRTIGRAVRKQSTMTGRMKYAQIFTTVFSVIITCFVGRLLATQKTKVVYIDDGSSMRSDLAEKDKKNKPWGSSFSEVSGYSDIRTVKT